MRLQRGLLLSLLALTTPLPRPAAAQPPQTETVALWLFDEQQGLYPSSLMTDAGPHDMSIVLGRGGRITLGRFGNALQAATPQELRITNAWGADQQELFGLVPTPKAPGRTVEPMTWQDAHFSALLTCGENHLRHMTFANASETGLNLGGEDWTVEFWFKADQPGDGGGVILEVGTGPRGENGIITRLSIDDSFQALRLINQPSNADLKIPTNADVLSDGDWHHVALVYDADEAQVRHWLDGKSQPLPAKVQLKALPQGDEAYMSLGRDGTWGSPMPGTIDELRISRGTVYTDDFEPPTSFSITYGASRPPLKLAAGPPLLFPNNEPADDVIELGSRKHVFIDDVIVERADKVQWVPNPPSIEELVLTDFHGHLTVIEDEDGLIRLYGAGPHDYLVVWTSKDGIRFEAPAVGTPEVLERKNVVVPYRTGTGQVFIDPNAPPQEKWKYLSGVQGQGMFIFTSPDGYYFTRHETAVLPFAAGSQSNIFYDDQRQLYVAYHRSDYGATSMTGQETERRFVVTEVKDLMQSWAFQPVTVEQTARAAKTMRIKSHLLDPWYLDNGPLAPGGFGIEFPVVFAPGYDLDPPHTDIYVPKAHKYPYAPDTYLAFPHIYFHYWDVDQPGRAELGKEHYQRGSGVIEVQTMVSRDGLNWKRYPRPAYVGIGEYGDMGQYYMVTMVQGMVRRGDEVWQYFAGSPEYHSGWRRDGIEGRRGVFRMVQRLDGFVSADADYTGGSLTTKPLTFTGDRLELNINTGAAGYARVGILDKDGKPFEGYAADDCVWINGNELAYPVKWLKQGADLSALKGKAIRLRFEMHGTKLYAMQFVAD